MGGQTTTAQNNSQQSQTAPWAAAQPQLQGLLANLGHLDTGVSPAQSVAAGMITNAAGAIPSFAPQLTNTANALLGGGPNYGGILSGAYGNLQGTLSPYLDPARLNPMSTPGFAQALGAMGRNITNQVNDQFAAAGRDLSPGNSAALAQGLAQGEAPAIASQYNANVGNQLNAANTLYNAGNTTASGLTGLAQTQFGNQLQGANLAGQLPGLLTGPAQAALAAANTAHGLPLQNLAQYQSLLTPFGGARQPNLRREPRHHHPERAAPAANHRRRDRRPRPHGRARRLADRRHPGRDSEAARRRRLGRRWQQRLADIPIA
jgi:hypothetical protein